MDDRTQGLTERITNQIVIIISLVFVFLGAALIYLNNTSINTTLSQIGGSLFTIGLISFVWQRYMTKAATDEVIEKTNLSHNLVSTGLAEAIGDFSEIDWKPLFNSVNKRLDLFFISAHSWTNSRKTLFDKIAEKKVEVHIILPDIEDEDTKLALKYRFQPDGDINEIVKKIEKTRAIYERKFSNKPAHLQIWYYKKPLIFSIYRFDNVALFALNSHSAEPPVPAFKFQNPKCEGSIYEFLDNEIDFLTPENNSEFSRKVHDNKIE